MMIHRNMNSGITKMWLCCFIISSVMSIAYADHQYLPPSKGYTYDVPKIPFTPRPPPTVRPPPSTTRPNTYLPPPTPPITDHPHNGHDHPHHPDDHHDHHDHDHHHHEPGMPFDFAYAVNEDGNDFSHNAKSDGDVTRGEYKIALPDGRTQIVRYTADWKNGFNAEVTYEGEARYPDQPNGSFPSGPAQTYFPPNQGEGYHY